MRRILSGIFSLYWAFIFAMTAFGIVRARNGMDGELWSKAFDFVSPLSEGAITAIVFGVGFAFASVVFMWTSAASAIAHSGHDGDYEDLMHLAFAVGATVILGSLIVTVVDYHSDALWSLTVQLGGLAACYVGAVAESQHVEIQWANKRASREHIARTMAKGAAHESTLPNIVYIRHGLNGVNS
jgi:hypothetical protein